MKRVLFLASAALILTSWAARVAAEDAPPPPNKVYRSILLDRPVKAGELTLFADQADDKAYFYVSDKPRLATDANGTPQFSFLRWVENARSGAEAPENRQGSGGGIIHALVSMGVSPEQIQQASSELQRVKPGARIVGPAMFSNGIFALVASVTDPNGKLATKVLGLGKAPLLDGQKAAVSIQLTELGAKVLWESFKTPAPDISFSFEMELTGLSSPFRAVLEADWEKVYQHQAFQAGFAHTYLGGEVNLTFDELRQNGAIKLTQVGTDPKWEEKLQGAYQTLTEMMFDKEPAGQAAQAAPAAGAGDGKDDILARATALRAAGRTEATAENTAIRAENEKTRAKNEEIRKQQMAAADARIKADAAKQKATQAETQVKALEKKAGDKPSDDDKKQITEARGKADTLTQDAKTADQEAAKLEREAPKELLPLRKEQTPPSFALLASYKLKKERKSGKFRIDLNKFSPATVCMRFDENIGDLRRLMNTDHFRQVNLDDPLYQQREIVAFVDGVNTQDFGQYVNFVTVQMRKKHAGGAVTDDEIRIDRNNFNAKGNNFKLLYGWKGDTDRRRWMEYEYRTVWSFFGGRQVEQPWQKSESGAIALPPPYQRRTVEVHVDPEMVTANGVRVVTVKLFYDLGAGEQMRQITLNAFKAPPVLSGQLEFMLPGDSQEYGYEVSYQLKGNRTVSTGRQRASTGVLIFDELPKQ